MKKYTISLAAASLLLSTAAHGQDGKFYFALDGGPSLASSSTLKQFGGVSPNAKIKFDTGGRLGIAGGYNLNQWVALELETGISFNSVKSFSGGTAAVASGQTDFYQVPLLLNAIVKIPTGGSKFVPFIGAGVGGATTVLNTDFLTVAGSGGAVSGYDTSIVFAAQGIAGLRYDISERVSLGFNYKYFYASEANFDTAITIKTGSFQAHSLNLALNFKF